MHTAQVPNKYKNLQTYHDYNLRKHCLGHNPMWQDLLGEVLWRQASHMAPRVYTTNHQHDVRKHERYESKQDVNLIVVENHIATYIETSS